MIRRSGRRAESSSWCWRDTSHSRRSPLIVIGRWSRRTAPSRRCSRDRAIVAGSAGQRPAPQLAPAGTRAADRQSEGVARPSARTPARQIDVSGDPTLRELSDELSEYPMRINTNTARRPILSTAAPTTPGSRALQLAAGDEFCRSSAQRPSSARRLISPSRNWRWSRSSRPTRQRRRPYTDSLKRDEQQVELLMV